MKPIVETTARGCSPQPVSALTLLVTTTLRCGSARSGLWARGASSANRGRVGARTKPGIEIHHSTRSGGTQHFLMFMAELNYCSGGAHVRDCPHLHGSIVPTLIWISHNASDILVQKAWRGPHLHLRGTAGEHPSSRLEATPHDARRTSVSAGTKIESPPHPFPEIPEANCDVPAPTRGNLVRLDKGIDR